MDNFHFTVDTLLENQGHFQITKSRRHDDEHHAADVTWLSSWFEGMKEDVGFRDARPHLKAPYKVWEWFCEERQSNPGHHPDAAQEKIF